MNFTYSSYYLNRIGKSSILNDIFLGPRKGTFSIFYVRDYFVKCTFTRTELKIVEDLLKHLKMTNISSNFTRTGVGPAKEQRSS